MRRARGAGVWVALTCAGVLACGQASDVESEQGGEPETGDTVEVAGPVTAAATPDGADDLGTPAGPAGAPAPPSAGSASASTDAGSGSDEFTDVPSLGVDVPADDGAEAAQGDADATDATDGAGDGDALGDGEDGEDNGDGGGDTTDIFDQEVLPDDTPPPPVDSTCGDFVIEGDEECEGLNLNGMTCGSLSAGNGLLGCDPVTCRFDTSLCIPPLTCGRFGCVFPTFP